MNRVLKALRNPRLAIAFISQRLTLLTNRVRAYFSAYLEGTSLEIAKDIRFLQRVIFSKRGKVIIGNKTSIGFKYGGSWHGTVCEFQPRFPESIIKIGANVATNNNLQIIAADTIEIGDYCLIGNSVQIIDFDAHGIDPRERRSSIGKVSPVKIGKNVWIGNRVIILKGVTIGNNSIVAAGSVVTAGDYPPDSIIGGNPARIIKFIENRSLEKDT